MEQSNDCLLYTIYSIYSKAVSTSRGSPSVYLLNPNPNIIYLQSIPATWQKYFSPTLQIDRTFTSPGGRTHSSSHGKAEISLTSTAALSKQKITCIFPGLPVDDPNCAAILMSLLADCGVKSENVCSPRQLALSAADRIDHNSQSSTLINWSRDITAW